MYEDIITHWSQLLSRYTEGEYRKNLLKAKDVFFDLTGKINEDEDEYEQRMACFNDWYISEFISGTGNTTILDKEIHDLSDEHPLKDFFKSLTPSLYVYVKKNFRKRIVLKDLVTRKKILLATEHPHMGIIEDDVFTGRVGIVNDEHYLLPGLCILPQEVKSLLAKEAKKVSKLDQKEKEREFILKLIGLKTKWLRYGHIGSEKVFSFS